MSELALLKRVRERPVSKRLIPGQALVGSALLVALVASCTGPPMPRHLRKFAEVDVLVPEVRRIRIVEVRVGSELKGMDDMERRHIAGELRKMIEGALGEAGYEIVSVGEQAELSLKYTQSRASLGDAAGRKSVADVSITVIDRKRGQLIYRGYSLHLPDTPPEGLSGFDVIKGTLEEHVGRIFGPGEWD